MRISQRVADLAADEIEMLLLAMRLLKAVEESGCTDEDVADLADLYKAFEIWKKG